MGLDIEVQIYSKFVQGIFDQNLYTYIKQDAEIIIRAPVHLFSILCVSSKSGVLPSLSLKEK